MAKSEGFEIVFQKLEEITLEEGLNDVILAEFEATAEVEEIEKLRKIVLEVTDPEPQVYMSC